MPGIKFSVSLLIVALVLGVGAKANAELKIGPPANPPPAPPPFIFSGGLDPGVNWPEPEVPDDPVVTPREDGGFEIPDMGAYLGSSDSDSWTHKWKFESGELPCGAIGFEHSYLHNRFLSGFRLGFGHYKDPETGEYTGTMFIECP